MFGDQRNYRQNQSKGRPLEDGRFAFEWIAIFDRSREWRWWWWWWWSAVHIAYVLLIAGIDWFVDTRDRTVVKDVMDRNRRGTTAWAWARWFIGRIVGSWIVTRGLRRRTATIRARSRRRCPRGKSGLTRVLENKSSSNQGEHRTSTNAQYGRHDRLILRKLDRSRNAFYNSNGGGDGGLVRLNFKM